jgi:hypothetical protein
LLNICSKIEAYEESKKNSPQNENWHFISIKHDGIYLNNVKTINKKAEKQFTTFKFLLKKQALGLLNAEHIGIKWYQIASEFENNTHNTFSEQQIRQIIYLIRKNIIEKHGELVCNEVLKFEHSVGYYFGPKTVVILR